MRYMILLTTRRADRPPSPELAEAMTTEIQAAADAGTLLDTGGLSEVGITRVSVTDGTLGQARPAVGTEQVVGGYAILEVATGEEAVDIAPRMLATHQQHWPSWDGLAEIRQITGTQEMLPN